MDGAAGLDHDFQEVRTLIPAKMKIDVHPTCAQFSDIVLNRESPTSQMRDLCMGAGDTRVCQGLCTQDTHA